MKTIQKENREAIEKVCDNLIEDASCHGDMLTLCAVLRALNKPLNSDSDEFACGGSGIIEINYYDYETPVKEFCPWDLAKPTLEEQSEETQKYIHKILTK